jgi:hypothetical protein
MGIGYRGVLNSPTIHSSSASPTATFAIIRLGARLRSPKESTKVGTMKRNVISNVACYNAPRGQCSILTVGPDQQVPPSRAGSYFNSSPIEHAATAGRM